MKRYFTQALCLLAITVPSQAQLLGQDVIPIDNFEPFSLPIDRPEFDIDPQLQKSIKTESTKAINSPQVTGADALLDEIPDANERVKNLAEIEVFDGNNNPALIEIQLQHGWRALKQEWLLLLTADQMLQLQSLPVSIISETDFPQLQMFTVRISVAERYDDMVALTKLLAPLKTDMLERHHVYDVQTPAPPLQSVPESGQAVLDQTISNQTIPKVDQHKKIIVGVIDTAFDDQHEALKRANIQTKSFVMKNMTQPTAHATAVLGRWVGEGEAITPMLPGASVYAASVFYKKDAYSQSASTIALLQALEWMLVKRVTVINMSLAGPPNALLEKALQRVRSEGIAVVAAAGNAGPASRPLFPAAYDSVIAVSAVDRKQRIYRWANRGNHIDFVAYGVNVTTLRAGGGEGTESGTSMAAPVISAALALQMQTKGLAESLTRLRQLSADLGKTGRDVIYGDGFIDQPH
jgi:minor extracellular protease Epr